MDNNQEAEDVVLLQWKYTPTDYFEETVIISHSRYTIRIENGTAEARIDPAIYDPSHKMRDELHEVVNARFIATLVVIHRPYQLSQSSYSRLYPNGRRDVTAFGQTAQVNVSDSKMDVIITDKNGNIVTDTRRDRIEKQKAMADLVERYRPRDPLVESLLGFYAAAVSDPANELVHLFDIREALDKKFGSKAAVLKQTGISDDQWKIIGRLANDEPLLQNRHRGKQIIKHGQLRNVKRSELEEARAAAKAFIEGYLRYLAKQDTF